MIDGGWQTAAHVLREGGVVASPTDTVWGLVTLASCAAGVDRIYAIKDRPADLELPLLAAAVADIEALVDFGPAARELAARFWPGALTMVVRCRDPRPAIVIPRRGDTLAVRVPAHRGLQALLAETGPLASTSANPHGRSPANTAGEVRRLLGDRVDFVVHATGPVGGVASTIVDCTVEPCTVIRAGAVDPFAGQLR